MGSFSFLDPLQPFDANKSLASQMTVARWNALMNYIKSLTLMPGVGNTLSQVGGGVAINARRKYGTPAALVALQPGSNVSTVSAPKYTITYGTYGGVVPTISGTALLPDVTQNIITLGASDVAVYMQCDFTYDASGMVTIVDAQIKSTSGPVPTSTITDGGMGTGGSGALYQTIFGVTITAPVGMNPYTVAAAPAVGGSQNFNVCLAGPSIGGPWGV